MLRFVLLYLRIVIAPVLLIIAFSVFGVHAQVEEQAVFEEEEASFGDEPAQFNDNSADVPVSGPVSSENKIIFPSHHKPAQAFPDRQPRQAESNIWLIIIPLLLIGLSFVTLKSYVSESAGPSRKRTH